MISFQKCPQQWRPSCHWAKLLKYGSREELIQLGNKILRGLPLDGPSSLSSGIKETSVLPCSAKMVQSLRGDHFSAESFSYTSKKRRVGTQVNQSASYKGNGFFIHSKVHTGWNYNFFWGGLISCSKCYTIIIHWLDYDVASYCYYCIIRPLTTITYALHSHRQKHNNCLNLQEPELEPPSFKL